MEYYVALKIENYIYCHGRSQQWRKLCIIIPCCLSKRENANISSLLITKEKEKITKEKILNSNIFQALCIYMEQKNYH